MFRGLKTSELIWLSLIGHRGGVVRGVGVGGGQEDVYLQDVVYCRVETQTSQKHSISDSSTGGYRQGQGWGWGWGWGQSGFVK